MFGYCDGVGYYRTIWDSAALMEWRIRSGRLEGDNSHKTGNANMIRKASCDVVVAKARLMKLPFNVLPARCKAESGFQEALLH
jgi:hypothetical protein